MDEEQRMERARQVIQSMGADGTLMLGKGGLEELPPLPAGAKKLLCQQNYLIRLPRLPDGLKSIYCWQNQLTELPTLPSKLEVLDCGTNLLRNLPTLPKGLVALSCINNQLARLPKLPSKLEYLNCENNELTTLPVLPKSLLDITCFNNPFIPPIQELVDKYEKAKGAIRFFDRDEFRKKVQLTKDFVKAVNQYLESKEQIKEGLVAAKYRSNKLEKLLEKRFPQGMSINSNQDFKNFEYLSDSMGEVWTHGVGQAYGPWDWQGGKQKTRKRKSIKRKTRKNH